MFDRQSSFDRTPFDREFPEGITIEMHGISTVEIDAVVPTPIPSFGILSDGGLEFDPYIFMPSALPSEIIENDGYISSDLILKLPLNINLNGDSDIEIFRIGTTGITLIDLKGISLQPGESITIDTDLMKVLINQVHDVSSLTSSSVFFMLGPGLNQLTFVPYYAELPDPRTSDELALSIIWQNRWL